MKYCEMALEKGRGCCVGKIEAFRVESDSKIYL